MDEQPEVSEDTNAIFPFNPISQQIDLVATQINSQQKEAEQLAKQYGVPNHYQSQRHIIDYDTVQGVIDGQEIRTEHVIEKTEIGFSDWLGAKYNLSQWAASGRKEKREEFYCTHYDSEFNANTLNTLLDNYGIMDPAIRQRFNGVHSMDSFNYVYEDLIEDMRSIDILQKDDSLARSMLGFGINFVDDVVIHPIKFLAETAVASAFTVVTGGAGAAAIATAKFGIRAKKALQYTNILTASGFSGATFAVGDAIVGQDTAYGRASTNEELSDVALRGFAVGTAFGGAGLMARSVWNKLAPVVYDKVLQRFNLVSKTEKNIVVDEIAHIIDTGSATATSQEALVKAVVDPNSFENSLGNKAWIWFKNYLYNGRVLGGIFENPISKCSRSKSAIVQKLGLAMFRTNRLTNAQKVNPAEAYTTRSVEASMDYARGWQATVLTRRDEFVAKAIKQGMAEEEFVNKVNSCYRYCVDGLSIVEENNLRDTYGELIFEAADYIKFQKLELLKRMQDAGLTNIKGLELKQTIADKAVIGSRTTVNLTSEFIETGKQKLKRSNHLTHVWDMSKVADNPQKLVDLLVEQKKLHSLLEGRKRVTKQAIKKWNQEARNIVDQMILRSQGQEFVIDINMLPEELRTRTIYIDESVLGDLVIQDPFLIVTHEIKNVVSRSEQKRVLNEMGYDTWDDVVNGIKAEFETKVKEAGNDFKLINQLRQSENAAIRLTHDVHDLINGCYNWDVPVWVAKSASIVRNLHAITHLGLVIVSQLDNPVNIVAEVGIPKALKLHMSMLGQGISASLIELKKEQLAEFTRCGICCAHEWENLALRYANGLEANYSMRATNIFEKWLDRIDKRTGAFANRIIRITGSASFDDLYRKAYGGYVVDRLLDVSAKGYEQLSKKEQQYLSSLRISKEMSERIAEQFKLYGKIEDGQRYARSSQWTDKEAELTLAGALSTAVNFTIVMPGRGTMPLWMRHPFANMFFQFKSFIFSYSAGMGQRLLNGELAHPYQYLFSAIALNTMSKYLKSILNDNPYRDGVVDRDLWSDGLKDLPFWGAWAEIGKMFADVASAYIKNQAHGLSSELIKNFAPLGISDRIFTAGKLITGKPVSEQRADELLYQLGFGTVAMRYFTNQVGRSIARKTGGRMKKARSLRAYEERGGA